jgi:adenine-specific DNA-methyltransferase
MELVYKGKKSKADILQNTKPVKFKPITTPDNNAQNMLIQGDNINVMQALLQQHHLRNKINLVYIDPPFATNTVFRGSDARMSHVSISNTDEIAYTDTRKGAEYLEFMRERLIFLRELMADTASIYVHIDYKIGHYLKIIMDEVFGVRNFRNDIARIKCNPKNFARKAFGNIKDLILFYTKTDKYTWNEADVPKSEQEIKRLFSKVDKNGLPYTTTPLHAPGETTNGNTGKMWRGMLPPKGRHWRYDPKVLDELEGQGLIEWSKTGNPRKIVYAHDLPNKKLQDIWEFKDAQRPVYPTEKNLELLKLIIQASSNEGDFVLDCFSGSGTTLIAAEALNRQWIGIDSSETAIKTTMKRLSNQPPSLFSRPSDFSYAMAA